MTDKHSKEELLNIIGGCIDKNKTSNITTLKKLIGNDVKGFKEFKIGNDIIDNIEGITLGGIVNIVRTYRLPVLRKYIIDNELSYIPKKEHDLLELNQRYYNYHNTKAILSLREFVVNSNSMHLELSFLRLIVLFQKISRHKNIKYYKECVDNFIMFLIKDPDKRITVKEDLFDFSKRVTYLNSVSRFSKYDTDATIFRTLLRVKNYIQDEVFADESC